jgi:hypothetical protein
MSSISKSQHKESGPTTPYASKRAVPGYAWSVPTNLTPMVVPGPAAFAMLLAKMKGAVIKKRKMIRIWFMIISEFSGLNFTSSGSGCGVKYPV